MTVDGLLYEHEAIRAHIRLVARLLWTEKTPGSNPLDNESALSFNAAGADLKKVLGSLHEGLRRHLQFEEEVLPGLIGDLLMESILIEHRKISREISEINSLLYHTGARTSSAKENDLGKRINDFLGLLMDHCETEDALLKLLRRDSPRGILI